MAQRGVGKHDQWRGYMTILVVDRGIIKFISLLTTVIRPIIKFEVDILWNCFRQKAKSTLAIS